MRTDHLVHTDECFESHMGTWLIKPSWLIEAVAAVQAGTMPVRLESSPRRSDDPGYDLLQGGVALIPMHGPMQKGRSKFGGVSTVEVRRSLRTAASDEAVSSIVLAVSSPGGTAAGTYELANEVRKVAARKPVHAHVEDIGASAAIYAIAHATRITANRPAEIGSIGCIMSLVDSSQRFEAAGIKVHVITTGEMKAAGMAGVEVTNEHLEYADELVQQQAALFEEALREGRGLSAEQMATVSDGRTFGPDRAIDLGLIDGISTLEDVVHEQIRSAAADRGISAAAAIASLDIEMAS